MTLYLVSKTGAKDRLKCKILDFNLSKVQTRFVGTLKISSGQTTHIDKEGFSVDFYIQKEKNSDFSALIVDVHGRHYRTKMKGVKRVYFVIKGKGTFTLDHETHQVQKGDMYIIEDGHEYEYEGQMKLFEFNIPAAGLENSKNLDQA